MTTPKKRKCRGRKPLLNRALLDQFVKALSQKGVTVRLACQTLSISEATFFRWLEVGADEDKGIYREFLEATTEARGKSQKALVAAIAKHSTKDWRAAAWLLERMAPKDWGNQAAFRLQAEAGAASTPSSAPKPGDELLTGGFSVAINITPAPSIADEG